MFVYQGKLNWYHYGVDETFVIILPSGPVRVGDSVYLFSQWTVDAQGNKKRNWFDTIIVDSVAQTQATDVTFNLKGAWYSYEITTQQGYGKLSVIMKNPNNGVSKPMPLDRIWQSEHELTGTTRIWTGKFSWMHFAQDEPAIFIVPDGFGEGKPILSLWQYTKDSAGKLKDPSFRSEVQKSVSGLDTDVVKFLYQSYYDISCTWDAKTDKLAVNVREGSHAEDVGDMIRSAIIERQTHSHDFNPPEPTPNKSEVEVRLPQAQSSLPRILTPLPFPKGLLETLTHTAAFVDQAGYLAKYAQDRFAALDADYHVLVQKLKAHQADVANLTKTKEELTLDRDAARAKAKELEDKLAKALEEAKNKETNYVNKIHELEDKLAKGAAHDLEDHKILEDTRKQLADAQSRANDLEAQLAQSKADVEDFKSRVNGLQDKIIEQQTIISRLETALDVQKKNNDALKKENGDLSKANIELQGSLDKTQGELGRANARIQDLEDTIEELRKRNTKLIDEKQELSTKANTAEALFENLDAQLRAIKKKAYEKGITL
ncbi:hypothetical protein ACJ41O_006242 [Fusarium nematophilum]